MQCKEGNQYPTTMQNCALYKETGTRLMYCSLAVYEILFPEYYEHRMLLPWISLVMLHSYENILDFCLINEEAKKNIFKIHSQFGNGNRIIETYLKLRAA